MHVKCMCCNSVIHPFQHYSNTITTLLERNQRDFAIVMEQLTESFHAPKVYKRLSDIAALRALQNVMIETRGTKEAI